ncbi:hypothetical protein MVES1_002442 [Malassezia vespertilionis]|uniref:Myb-like domain-containing protein n=1 Tax=Malassezia vespertilionis TaxID=2020962 RepID=A0A2N1JB18_9BASI|nr:uncharacterized protein MVES1_002442 [Malassezia vespertilionis]PKI83733.1 hypothetical protein MVES_002306 [Malassezia vespertilionis]WFD07086.1 hypothetical protein MVES1_002442 [Malassezia vespertilionis]
MALGQAPGKRSVRAYAILIARSIWQERRVNDVPCLDDHTCAWWAHWTLEEKSLFYQGLARYSRLQPDLIAEHIRTRSVEEICTALSQFRKMLRRVKQMETARYRGDPHARARVRRAFLIAAPAARQMSAAWLEFEERHASILCEHENTVASRADALQMALDPAPYTAEAVANVARFLRAEQSGSVEQLYCVLRRMLHLDDEKIPAVPVPTPAYAASHLVLPPIPSKNALVVLVRDISLAGFWSLENEEGCMVTHSAELLDPRLRVRWPTDERISRAGHDAECIDAEAGLMEGLLDTALPAQRKGMQVMRSCSTALEHELHAFLTRVMYELVSVGERSLYTNNVDEQHVWATIARLGFPISIHPDVVEPIAEARAVADPPAAWTAEVPLHAQDPDIVVPEAYVTNSPPFSPNTPPELPELPELPIENDTPLSPFSLSEYSSSSEAPSDTAYDFPWRIGELHTLVPFEHTEMRGDPRTKVAHDTPMPEVPAEQASLANTHAVSQDQVALVVPPDHHVDVFDTEQDTKYEQRLVHAWFGDTAMNDDRASSR